MAEVAAAASIIQIITFALHSANVLFDFIEGIRNAPKEIRSIRQDVQALGKTIQAIHTCMQSGIIRDTAAGLLRESLMSCGSNLRQLRRLLGRFTHKKEWNSAFMWRWSRDEIQRLRNNISHSKQTLGLSLAVVQTHSTEAGNRRLSQKIDTAIRPIRMELFSFYEKWLERESLERSPARKQSFQHRQDTDRAMTHSIFLGQLPAGSHPWAKAKLDDTLSLGTL
jgi:Fungal N-terminal domain of STAND proteins